VLEALGFEERDGYVECASAGCGHDVFFAMQAVYEAQEEMMKENVGAGT